MVLKEDPLNSELNRPKKRKKQKLTRYECFKCEYSASTASNLKLHMKSKHEGVRYPCNKCEYVATEASTLKRHVHSKHD